ncbi:unnamed protein product, partial [Callosobruchus maculatus]
PVPFLCPFNSTQSSSEFDDIPKRFPAELRHPNPAPLASGGNLWNTEKKVEGSVQNGPRNPQSSIGGYPSMY